jgi:hypothetical protein
LLFTLAAIALSGLSSAQARVVTQISPSAGPGLGNAARFGSPMPVFTLFPNNDNSVAASLNQNPFPGTLGQKLFQAVAPIDTVLHVQLSQGSTEYFFMEEVINQTALAWDGFSFELGFGNGRDFTPFDALASPVGARRPCFDTPQRDPAPFASAFPTLSHEEARLLWTGGLVQPGGSIRFTFSIDVPDDETNLDLYSNFTLRLLPVPEPATSALLLIGLAGAARTMRRRRRPSPRG